MGAAVIEGELETLLRQRFKRKDQETWMNLIGEHGPLGSFAAKIIAGYAFGLYDNVTLSNLHKVRSIRNTFAHSKKLLTFKEKEIIKHLNSISMPANTRSKRFKKLQAARSYLKDNDPQNCYVCLGLCIISDIMNVKYLRKKRTIYATRARLGSTLKKFVDLATSHSVVVPEYIYQLIPKSHRKSSRANRSAYPKRKSTREYLSSLSREADEEEG